MKKKLFLIFLYNSFNFFENLNWQTSADKNIQNIFLDINLKFCEPKNIKQNVFFFYITKNTQSRYLLVVELRIKRFKPIFLNTETNF